MHLALGQKKAHFFHPHLAERGPHISRAGIVSQCDAMAALRKEMDAAAEFTALSQQYQALRLRISSGLQPVEVDPARWSR
jgi:hypothetical protein